MKICGFKINNVYVDKNGIIRKRTKRGKQNIQTNVICKLFGNNTLAKLVKLDTFFKAHGFDPLNVDFRILVEITQKFLKCSESSAYEYAFVVWALKN